MENYKLQTTSTVMMVRPSRFGYNTQTAISNTFQNSSDQVNIAESARKEFDAMVAKLRAKSIEVLVFEELQQDTITPDAIFPNNWISFHENGSVVLYPMMAENRRAERRSDILSEIKKSFQVEEVIDLTSYEDEEKFLEGTGSLVLDRIKKVAYAAISPRTDPKVVNEFAVNLGYEVIFFTSYDQVGTPVYHTNVMMSIGDRFAIICLDSITDSLERESVENRLELSGKAILPLTMAQMESFAGNMLLLRNTHDKEVLVMSDTAYASLYKNQIDWLEESVAILRVSIPTIENIGGGSARCVIAEIHLPSKKEASY